MSRSAQGCSVSNRETIWRKRAEQDRAVKALARQARIDREIRRGHAAKVSARRNGGVR